MRAACILNGEVTHAFSILIEKSAEKDDLKDLSAGGIIISKCILKIRCKGVDWIHLVQHKSFIRRL